MTTQKLVPAERPWLARTFRAVELLGLLALIYGLAASSWWLAAGGVAVIVLSYVHYRRIFPVHATPDSRSMGMGDGGD